MDVLPGVLAIDAGNSKTDAALVGLDGRVLAVARGGPFTPHHGRTEAAVGVLDEVVSRLRSQLGIAATGPVARHASACLANADLPVEVAELEKALASLGWAGTTEVFNDTYALLRSGLDAWRGVAVVCGAGINCTGVMPDGRVARFAALGQISGDWGGGGHLWQEAMWWAARAEDGRGDDTALRLALPAHFGLATMAGLIEAVHLESIPEHRCLELTPVLFAVAEAGDDVARRVVRRQAEEVVALAVAALRRLDALDEPMEVVLGGGVLAAGHALLLDAVAELLGAQAPLATARVVATPPVAGAALLGLDRIGADAGALARLREHYEQP
ncbi:MAG: BadF/BadG/BcrA/BcrD ATPase family protein [Nocardioidaceae bacterium]